MKINIGLLLNAIRPFTVIVEGNIGSGKTRFLNHFRKYDNVCICPEPVLQWQNCKGHNLLKLLYEDPKKWSFSFQSYVQLTMVQQHSLKTEKQVKLMERSIYSARYCFVEKLFRDNLLPKPSKSVIHEWFKWIIDNANTNVDLVVYIRTTPEVVYERVKARDREEERTIPLEYLKGLHELHENWLYYKTLHYCPAPVLVMDGNLDKTIIDSEYEKFEPNIFKKISAF